MKRAVVILVGGFVSVAGSMVLFRLEPTALTYHVWDELPGSVIDQDGRVGRIYFNGSSVLHVVVFEKGYSVRRGSRLGRFIVPHHSVKGFHAQITFDVKTLRGGMGGSDEVFDDFLLSRRPGVGWNGVGEIELKELSKGDDLHYVATVGRQYQITIRPKMASLPQQ